MPERIKFNAHGLPVRVCMCVSVCLCVYYSVRHSLTGCIKLCIKMALMTFIQLCQPRNFPRTYKHILGGGGKLCSSYLIAVTTLSKEKAKAFHPSSCFSSGIPSGMKIATKMLCLQFKMSVWVGGCCGFFCVSVRGSFTAAAYIYVAM